MTTLQLYHRAKKKKKRNHSMNHRIQMIWHMSRFLWKCRTLCRCFTYYSWSVVLKYLDCLPYFSVFIMCLGVVEGKEQESLSKWALSGRQTQVELRSIKGRQSVLIHWVCVLGLLNKIPQTGWLIKNRKLFSESQGLAVWDQGGSMFGWGLSFGSQTSCCILT